MFGPLLVLPMLLLLLMPLPSRCLRRLLPPFPVAPLPADMRSEVEVDDVAG